MKLIGLTGGVGMGKSTAAAAFRRARIPVFDADAAVHRLQAKGGRAVRAIASAFPSTEIDGAIDRGRLRAMVVHDTAALRRLEKIIHPLVQAEQRGFIARAHKQGCTMAVLDVPLLFETGANKRVDYIISVSAPLSVQRHRVRLRRRMTDSEIAAIIARQVSDLHRRRHSDLVIRTGLSRFEALKTIRRFLATKGLA